MNKETSLKKRENSRKSRIALNLFIKKSLKTKGLSSTEINYAVRGKGSEKRLIAINEWTNLPQPEKEEYNQLAEQELKKRESLKSPMERYVNKQLYLCELEETKRFLSPSEKLEKTQVFQAKWLNEMSPEEKAEYEMAPIVEKKRKSVRKLKKPLSTFIEKKLMRSSRKRLRKS